MRAKLLGAVLAALFAPLALAGDITPKGKIAAPVAAQADETNQWHRSGFYLAALGAYDVTTLQVEGFDLASGKLMAGAELGYRHRMGAIVAGIAADWMFTGISASTEAEEVSLRASTNHLISVRAMAGVPFGPALVYVTAGPAWQHAKLSIEDGPSDRSWQLGAALGGGAEIELSRTLSIRLEALHDIFPDDAPLSEILNSENQHTTVRAGVLFRLN